MKYTAILLFLLSITSYSQESLEFDTIVEVESIKKEKLFEILNDWVAINFNSANDVIQLSDKQNGKLIVKGLKNYSLGRTLYNCYNGHISFTLRILVKNNKYRVTLFQLKHQSINDNACSLGSLTKADLYATKGWGKRYQNKIWADLKIKSDDLNKTILSSIKQKIQNFSKVEKW